MKRFMLAAVLAALLVCMLAPAAAAEETQTTAATEATEAEEKELGGWMSDNFRWKLEDGVLTISGEGVMPGEAPWREYSEEIETLYLEDGVLTVCGGAFRGCTALKEIRFGGNLSEIGDYAFQGCESLVEIRLPQSFRRFGAYCFAGCTSLTQVYCDGYMPRFSEACLWNDGRVYVYYSPDRVWGIDDIKPLERVYGGRMEFLCQDGTDPIANDEGDPKPLAPVLPATEPVETVPPTVPETEPPTVPVVVTVPETTVPATTAPEETVIPETTVPETLEPETIWEPTEPELLEEETVRGGFIGLALILGVLTFFIVGALIFKIRSRRGKY